jgi:hypothetical protein
MKRKVLLLAVASALMMSMGVVMAQTSSLPSGALQTGQSPQDAEPQFVSPVGTAFTYQGLLKLQTGTATNPSPVTGNCDFQFTLWDAVGSGSPPTGGTQKGTVALNNVSVKNGLFTVQLDFGSVYNGEQRFLQTAARCPAGSGSLVTLAPRQTLTAVPYAAGLVPGVTIGNPNSQSTARLAFGGVGVIGEATCCGSAGVQGKNATGGGVGVEADGGSGPSGFGLIATSLTGGTGVWARGGAVGLETEAATPSDTAVLIWQGGIKVHGAGIGTNTPVFIHKATAATIPVGSTQQTIIDNPLTNGAPNAILIVTPNYNPNSTGNIINNHPIGVFYNGTKWGIFNEDLQPMPLNATFNVLVVKP